MRALFGVASLLVVLSIVGVLVTKSLRSTQRSLSAASTTATGASAVPGAPAQNVREQSRQLQEQVQRDVARALEQGAKRTEADEK